jgi:hypothetical protein
VNRVNAIALLVMSVAFAVPRATRAATANITLTISGCEAAGVHADRLFDLARTELSPRTVLPGTSVPDLRAPRLSVQLCQDSANQVTLEWQAADGPVVLRQIDLSDVVGDLRMRTLAVAMADLVASAPDNAVNGNDNVHPSQGMTGSVLGNPLLQPQPTSTALVVKSPPPQKTAPNLQRRLPEPPTRADQARNSPSQSPALHASAGAAVREFFNPRTTLVGPWVSVAGRRVSGEALLLVTSDAVANGTGTVSLYDTGLAGIYRAISWGSSLVSSVNLRVEVGSTWARGEPGNAANVRKLPTKAGARLGSALDFATEARLTRNVGLQLHLLLGADAWGVKARAFDQAVASTNGLFAGAALGLQYGRID